MSRLTNTSTHYLGRPAGQGIDATSRPNYT
jgi:hypothetical protein